MVEDGNHHDATKNVHAGTNHIGESVNTPIFLSSTYKLTEERYAGWAAGAQRDEVDPGCWIVLPSHA